MNPEENPKEASSETHEDPMSLAFVRAETLVGVSVEFHGGLLIEITSVRGLDKYPGLFITIQTNRIVIHGPQP